MTEEKLSRENIRSFILIYFKLGRSAEETRQDLFTALGVDAPGIATVYRWRQKFRNGDASLDDEDRAGRPTNSHAVEVVRAWLDEHPNSSVRVISCGLTLPRSTVYDILTKNLGLRKFKSKWIPHMLTDEQKSRRISLSRDLLSILSGMSERKLCSVITADESWFHLTTDRDGRWAERPEDVPPRVKGDFPRKVMVFVAWCPYGPKLVVPLPPNTSFNSTFVSDVLVERFKEAAIFGKKRGSLEGLVLHWDNARPHVSNVTTGLFGASGVTTLPHPPYSPDVAPCDFYLFGYLKHLLAGQSFDNADDLVQAIWKIMEQIPKSVYVSVYTEWMTRLQRVIDLEGEYYF